MMNGSNNDCASPMLYRRSSSRLRHFLAPVLGVWMPFMLAASPGDLPEKPAYQHMLAGDRALEAGDLPRALSSYQQALTLFERLRRERPEYKVAAMEYRMDYCRKRIAALLADPTVQAAQTPTASPPDRLRELEAALEQLQGEHNRTRRELQVARENLERAAARANLAEARVRELQSRLQTAAERTSALERELAATREHVSADEHQQTLTALRDAVSERDAFRRRAETAEQSAALLREKLAAVETRLRQLDADLRSSPPDVTIFEEQLREARRQAESAARSEAAAAARIESLSAQLQAAREQIRALKAAAHATETAALQRRVADLDRERTQLAAERDAATAELERLRGDLERLEAASRDDRERIRELGRALKSAAEPSPRAEQELRELLQKITAERDAAREQVAALQRRLNDLHTARGSTGAGAADLVQADLRDQLRRAEARLQALAAKLDLRDREARETERERDALRAELERVRAGHNRLIESAGRTARRASAEPPAPSEASGRPPSPAAELSPELRQQLETATSLLSSNQPGPALQLFDQVLTVLPNHPDALLGYGRAALALGQTRPARAAAERLTTVHPELAGGHHLRGLVEARDNNLRTAGRAFAHAVALEPDNPMYHRDFAIACYRLNRIDDAIAEYREVIRLDPNDGKAHFNLAALLMMQRSPPLDEIRALYRRALELGEPPDAQFEQRLAP